MTDLIATLLFWIGSLTGYDVDLPNPHLAFADRTHIAWVLYGRRVSSQARHVEATYDHVRQVIYLPDDWDAERPADVAKLLHELVHYVQYHNGRYETANCLGELEPEAYQLQYRWLREQGVPRTFPALTVWFRSMCE